MNVKPAAVNGAREFSALGEKAVTRMNRFGVDFFRCRDDGVDLQVALSRRGWSNQHRFISHAHVQALDVCFGIDRDSSDAQLAAGTNDADGDLASVSDQDFAEHSEVITDIRSTTKALRTQD